MYSNLVSTIYKQIMTSNLVSITQNKIEQQLTGIFPVLQYIYYYNHINVASLMYSIHIDVIDVKNLVDLTNKDPKS